MERQRLPETRVAVTRRFTIPQPGTDPLKIYVTVGLYEDRRPGELFIRASTVGSLAHGMLDAFAIAVSIALQHGVPLEALTSKFVHTGFEPAGATGDPTYPMAKSVIDLVARWLRDKFPTGKKPTTVASP